MLEVCLARAALQQLCAWSWAGRLGGLGRKAGGTGQEGWGDWAGRLGGLGRKAGGTGDLLGAAADGRMFVRSLRWLPRGRCICHAGAESQRAS